MKNYWLLRREHKGLQRSLDWINRLLRRLGFEEDD